MTTTLTVKQPAALTTAPQERRPLPCGVVGRPTTPRDYAPEPLKMRYEDFLAWCDEDTHAEWVPVDSSGYGEIIVQMPPKLIHQEITSFLIKLLGLFAHMFDLGKLIAAPFEVKLQPGHSSRDPDILFVATENLDRLTQERLNGPPDLVIEVVSESSVKRDRDEKFKEYRDAGVREYWIIDPRPEKQRADFYRLDEAGTYTLYATEDDERIVSHVVPGFWLRPAWLWQADTINPLTALFEIRGIPAAQIEQIEQILSGEW